jgi:hypothetical protein
MKIAIIIIAVASACVLLLIGAGLFVETASAWQALQDTPRAVVDYLTSALSSNRVWTIAVICGIISAIVYTNAVPRIKSR